MEGPKGEDRERTRTSLVLSLAHELYIPLRRRSDTILPVRSSPRAMDKYTPTVLAERYNGWVWSTSYTAFAGSLSRAEGKGRRTLFLDLGVRKRAECPGY